MIGKAATHRESVLAHLLPSWFTSEARDICYWHKADIA